MKISYEKNRVLCNEVDIGKNQLQYFHALKSDWYEIFHWIMSPDDYKDHNENISALWHNHVLTVLLDIRHKNLKEYAKTRSNPYRISYEEICKEVMGAKQKSQLRRLIGFKFKRHPSLNLPEERLEAIEKQVGERVRELLSLPSLRKAKRRDEPTR